MIHDESRVSQPAVIEALIHLVQTKVQEQTNVESVLEIHTIGDF